MSAFDYSNTALYLMCKIEGINPRLQMHVVQYCLSVIVLQWGLESSFVMIY